MTKKPSISAVPQTTTNTVTINNNFSNIRDAFDNTLSLDGSTPNTMQADLDMDGNDIINAGNVFVDGVNYEELLRSLAEDAADSKEAAATSESNAATSATNASNSADAAEAAKTNAEAAKTNAEAAQTGAETAETNAEASEAQTLVYRNQTAVLAAAAGAPSGETLPTLPDGDYPVSSYFRLLLGPGIKIYRNDANVWVDTGIWERGPEFDTVALLLADTSTSYGETGVIVKAGGYRYEQAASGATDHHVTTAGGVNLYIPTNQTITPFMWGVEEEPEGTFGGADQSAKLQAFFSFIHANACPDVDWSGSFAVANTITTPRDTAMATKNTRGRLFLRGMNDLAECVIRLGFLPEGGQYGALVAECFGGNGYSIRNTPAGIIIDRARACKFDVLDGRNAQVYPVWFGDNPAVVGEDNSNLLNCGYVRGFQCGSGSNAATSLEATIFQLDDYNISTSASSPSSLGDGSTSQATRIALTLLSEIPPASLAIFHKESTNSPFVAGFTENDEAPVFAQIGNEVYHVIHINRVAGQVWVYPKVSSNVVVGGTVRWIFGGGPGIVGSDTNLIRISSLDVASGGIAVPDGSFYGCSIGVVNADACAIGLTRGGDVSGAALPCHIGLYYTEGCTFDIVIPTTGAQFEIDSVSGDFDLASVVGIAEPTASGVLGASFATLERGGLTLNGKPLYRSKSRGTVVGSYTWQIDRPDQVDVLRGDTFTLNLSLAAGLERTTGVDGAILTVVGTGTNRAPATLTFNPPTGHTINGGAVDATVAFSGFVAPANFVVSNNGSTAWTVTPLRTFLPQSAPADPGTPTASNDVEARSAIVAIKSALLNAGILT